MGAPPDLPDPSENELRPSEAVHMPISDESDNDLMEYDGYEPLALDDFNDSQETDDEQENRNDLNGEIQTTATAQTDPNLPNIERAEIEIERQVWNAPRPQETNITLDETKTAQILNAMANFTLPNITLPEWADPDDRWKDELLERIRQRKELQQNERDVSDEQKPKL